MPDAARDTRIEPTARARRAEAEKIVQCVGGFTCVRLALEEIAQRRYLTGHADKGAFDFAGVTNQGRQRLGAACARLEIKHCERIAADIELIRQARWNDRRAAGNPPRSRQAQAEPLVEPGEIDRDAVTVRSIVAERPDEQMSARRRHATGAAAGSQFWQHDHTSARHPCPLISRPYYVHQEKRRSCSTLTRGRTAGKRSHPLPHWPPPRLSSAPLASNALAAAPQLGAWQPKFWRFKFGAFEFTTIADSEAFIDGPYPIIGKNATEDEVRGLMRGNLVQEQRYQPGFSPTVINTGKELVLFDTGNGATGFVPRPNGGWLAAQLGPCRLQGRGHRRRGSDPRPPGSHRGHHRGRQAAISRMRAT